MTPDERLDQLEPILSETTAILDRHTAQLRQHAGLLKQLVQATEANGQLMQQLLTTQQELRTELADFNTPFTHPTSNHSDIVPAPVFEQQLAAFETRLDGMGGLLETLGGKMDLILTKLIRVYINN